MVRRWSSITRFNLFFKLTNLETFKKLAKKRIFKLTVSTRKFYKRYTRFRRKSFNRLRHKSNWTIYANVFKFWSYNYQNAKTFYKKYWLNSIFKYSFLSFNWNCVKLTHPDLFFNSYYHLLSFNAFFNYKSKLNKNKNLINFNSVYANLSIGYIENLAELEIKEDASFFFYDLQIYEYEEFVFFSDLKTKYFFLEELFKNSNIVTTQYSLNFYQFLLLTYFL